MQSTPKKTIRLSILLGMERSFLSRNLSSGPGRAFDIRWFQEY
jgi:hypothetical protein